MGSKRRRHATKVYNSKRKNRGLPNPPREVNSICWTFYQDKSPYDKRLDEWIGKERFLTKKDIEKHQRASANAATKSTFSSRRRHGSEGKTDNNNNNNNSNNSSSLPFSSSSNPHSSTLFESKKDNTKERSFRSLRLRSTTQDSQLNPFDNHSQDIKNATAITNSSSLVINETIAVANQRKPFNDPVLEALEREHEEATKVKNIQMIEIGRYEIDCWYFSPYPDEYSEYVDKLFICEKCLKYMKSEKTYVYHWNTCKFVGPPERLIYWKDNLVVYELDGSNNKLYCQNLCLMSKLFLDHKTLYYDVSPFWFYVLCEVDDSGVHIAGYFSKEKHPSEDYNLACIMILPPYQKKGYGRFLIDLSYELTRREGKTGSPERPLSDLGLVSYRSYWTFELIKIIKNLSLNNIPSLEELSDITGFTIQDIIETLEQMKLLKNWRGQQVLCINNKILKDLWSHYSAKKICELNRESLIWPQ